MLRLIFVVAAVAVGLFFALRHPFYALLLYLWNGYFRPESWVWDPTHVLEARLSYVFALIVIAMCVIRREAFSARALLRPHVALVGMFALQGLASTLTSSYSDYAWPFWVEFVKVVVITALIVALVDDAWKFRACLATIAYSMGFEGAKQGWIELIRRPGGINQNPIPFLGDNNGVAVGMLMLVPVFAALARTSSSFWERRLHQFFLLGVLYRGVTTYSRGGFVAALVLGLVSVLRFPQKGRVVAAIAVSSALVLPVLPRAFWDRMETIVTFRESQEESAISRLHFWDVAVEMARDRPVMGIGFNAFNIAYDRYDDTQGAFGGQRSVHSSWLGVLSELGYLGFAFYCLIFLLALRNCWVARRAEDATGAPGTPRAFAVALEASLVVFFVGGTFLPNQYNEMAWHSVGLSIALSNLVRRRWLDAQPAQRRSARPADRSTDPPGPVAPASKAFTASGRRV